MDRLMKMNKADLCRAFREMDANNEQLRQRIAELEEENKRLREWVEATNPWRDEQPGGSITVDE